jgi:hypothetical protein
MTGLLFDGRFGRVQEKPIDAIVFSQANSSRPSSAPVLDIVILNFSFAFITASGTHHSAKGN